MATATQERATQKRKKQLTDDKIDETLATLSDYDKAKLNRFTRATLKNQGMAAEEGGRTWERISRQIVSDIYGAV